jgi:hypothetical protein
VDLIARPTALNLASNPATTPGAVQQIAPASGAGRKVSPERKAKVSPERKAKVSPERKAKVSPKTRKSPSGSGSKLPAIDRLDWENHSDGGKEAWHAPPGTVQRRDKTYLGHVGKRQLAAWERLDPDARQKAVEEWIKTRREEKGIQ